jgi:hypothetical protein
LVEKLRRLTNIAQFVVIVSGEPFIFEEMRNALRTGSPEVSYGVNMTTGVVLGHLVTEDAYTLERLRFPR